MTAHSKTFDLQEVIRSPIWLLFGASASGRDDQPAKRTDYADRSSGNQENSDQKALQEARHKIEGMAKFFREYRVRRLTADMMDAHVETLTGLIKLFYDLKTSGKLKDRILVGIEKLYNGSREARGRAEIAQEHLETGTIEARTQSIGQLVSTLDDMVTDCSAFLIGLQD